MVFYFSINVCILIFSLQLKFEREKQKNRIGVTKKGQKEGQKEEGIYSINVAY